MVLDSAEAGEQLSAAELACPACGQALAPWGYARPRSVRARVGRVQLRPRRARCRHCRTTHVLLPAFCLPRRSVTIDVVGAALLATADGAGYRAIAAGLDLPADTVRGWVRRATARTPWLEHAATTLAYQFDPELPPMQPSRSAFADALTALGAAAAAATRRFGLLAPPWHLIAMITGGRLLGPLPRAG